jgi:uncharacterized protein
MKSNSKSLNQKQAVALLRKYSKSPKDFRAVLEHSLAVQKVAVKIARQVNADLEFVKIASLLHDIGRFNCKPHTIKSIKHGVVGYDILKKEGFTGYADVALRHMGIGITKHDIEKQHLPLPHKNLVPITKEEKVIAYADKLAFGSRIGTIQEVIKRFSKEIYPSYGVRIKHFHNKLVDMGYRAKKL